MGQEEELPIYQGEGDKQGLIKEYPSLELLIQGKVQIFIIILWKIMNMKRTGNQNRFKINFQK